MKEYVVDKTKLIDTLGRPLTYSLFVESKYARSFAVYTLRDHDKVIDGKIYPSLKQFYLDCEDPTEYEFANKYLLNWKHWERLNLNKDLKEIFEEWRLELNLRLRSSALKTIMDQALTGENFQASKFIVEGNWRDRPRGRPSKEEAERDKIIREKLTSTYSDDVERLQKVISGER